MRNFMFALGKNVLEVACYTIGIPLFLAMMVLVFTGWFFIPVIFTELGGSYPIVKGLGVWFVVAVIGKTIYEMS